MRTGDTVLHKPSGERWVVAYVQGEYMAWCGWPEGEAYTADCEVVRACSDAEHLDWLRRIAESSGKRGRVARLMLAERTCLRCGQPVDNLTGMWAVPGGHVCAGCKRPEEALPQAKGIGV